MSETYPKKVEELPNQDFYAILTATSVTIPGDERSRTNPGHGYPEHSEDYWELQVFPSREAWVAEIERLSSQTGYYRKQFKAIRAIPASVTTRVEVQVPHA